MVAVNLLASLLTTNNLCTSIVWTSLLVLQWRISSNIVCLTLVVLCRLSHMRSPLRGEHVSLFLWNKLTCSSVPSNFVFLYSLFPNIVYVPLKIWPVFLCSPEENAIFPCSPKPLRMPHMRLTDKPGQWAQQSKMHIVWLQSNQIEQNWIYRFRVNLNKIGTPK